MSFGEGATDHPRNQAVAQVNPVAALCLKCALAVAVEYEYVWSPRYIDAPILRLNTTGPTEETHYYLGDANFNVTAIINPSGTVLERYVYTPYGERTIYNADWSQTRASSLYDTTYSFTGRRLDAATGLYHFRMRQYDPGLGQFLSRDPIGYASSALTLLGYTSSSPQTRVDPTGQYEVVLASCGKYATQEIHGFAAWLRELLESPRDCWSTNGNPCACRAQLKDCVLATLKSQLKFRCERNIPGKNAAFSGKCATSKTRADREHRSQNCTACHEKDLKFSRIRVELRQFIPRKLSQTGLQNKPDDGHLYRMRRQWFYGLLLHEVLHACVGDHGDDLGRPDAENLAMEFMVRCGGGWVAKVDPRLPISSELPPRYRPKTIKSFPPIQE